MQISLLPPSLPNKVVLNGFANFHAESIESEHPEHYQESKFAAVQNTVVTPGFRGTKTRAQT